ncbi:hypothetical protein E2562_028952 [Oryza meyeriana var. granulata]|uniref:Uncharacterized protein n=1 Tax=Oryza meyeriana var. granulata TaxID=110450 RepID=A0A6G1DPN6_9ORYZ|nr:hypothetical protein E2562_028952 [Oryza meyeriana var. granulata]
MFVGKVSSAADGEARMAISRAVGEATTASPTAVGKANHGYSQGGRRGGCGAFHDGRRGNASTAAPVAVGEEGNRKVACIEASMESEEVDAKASLGFRLVDDLSGFF